MGLTHDILFLSEGKPHDRHGVRLYTTSQTGKEVRPVQRFTEAIKIICTVINTLYPILKDLRKKKDQRTTADPNNPQG